MDDEVEREAHSAWADAASEAARFFQAHGGETMSETDRALYELLVGEARAAGDRHEQTLRDPEA